MERVRDGMLSPELGGALGTIEQRSLTAVLAHHGSRECIQNMAEVLRKESAAGAGVLSSSLFAANPAMRALRKASTEIARSEAPVMIEGEIGVGKRTLARQIHSRSGRAAGPFLTIHCAQAKASEIEAEMSGHPGQGESKIILADGGSLLVHEIDQLPMEAQARLLRVFEAADETAAPAAVRIFSTSRTDLLEAVRNHRLRPDLYYRLSAISLKIPPLRERRDEILPLAELFLKKYARPDTTAPVLSTRVEAALVHYPWPGNIRELENAMQRAIIFGDPELVAKDLFRQHPLRPAF